MTTPFIKFPSTPHLAVLGSLNVREDKVMSDRECQEFLSNSIVVEEKMDGANLGISVDESGEIRAQNRGSYLHRGAGGQWKKLDEWIKLREDSLFDVLGERYILFGEWCYARHSIYYSRLPDWFLGYDVYDRVQKRFLSCERRDKVLQDLGIHKVPLIDSGKFSLEELISKFGTSVFGDQTAEGLYLRRDDGKWLGQRAKLVRPDFLQAISAHWSKSGVKPNQLACTVDAHD